MIKKINFLHKYKQKLMNNIILYRRSIIDALKHIGYLLDQVKESWR